jgi:hypothetical protein
MHTAVELPLPAGWYAEISERGTYYWREDGTVQWERPTTAAAAQPAHTTVQSSSTPDSILVIKQAAAAGALFVAGELGVEVAGYVFSRDGSSGAGYYRQPDAPPPDDAAYSRIVLQRASAAGASFIRLDAPLDGFELEGYVHGHGPSGSGYYLTPAAPSAAGAAAVAATAAAAGAAAAAAAAAAGEAAVASSGASSSTAESHAASAAAPVAAPTAAEVAAWCAANQVR